MSPDPTTNNMGWFQRIMYGWEVRKQQKRDHKRKNSKAKRADRDQQRTKRRTNRREWFHRNGQFSVTLALITASVSVAVPFQFVYFWGVFAGGGAPDLVAIPGAALITAVIEGMTWHGAVYYFATTESAIGRLYRAETVTFALIASGVNLIHGTQEYGLVVGVSFALASLTGVGVWELHMMRTKQVRTGMNVDQIRLWRSRRKHHKTVVTEAHKIRATFGLGVPLETAWRMAYVRHYGSPTVPVSVTDEVAAKLLGEPAGRAPDGTTEPADAEHDAEQNDPSEAASSSGVGVLEVPVDWSRVTDLGYLVEQFWPDVEFHNDEPTSSSSTPTDAEQTAELPAVPEGRNSEQEQGVTSSVPSSSRNGTRNNDGNNARNNHEGTPEHRKPSGRNSGRKFQATKAELEAEGTRKDRLRKYLARAERNKINIEDLDQDHIAQQFGVTGRYVRTLIAERRTANATEGNQS